MSEPYGCEVGGRTATGIRLLVSGELDLEVAPRLVESIVDGASSCEPGDRVVLDLGGVTFIDSSGLAALVDAHRRITDQGKALLLGNVSERVQRVVTLTGLDHLFEVEVEAELAAQDRAS